MSTPALRRRVIAPGAGSPAQEEVPRAEARGELERPHGEADSGVLRNVAPAFFF